MAAQNLPTVPSDDKALEAQAEYFVATNGPVTGRELVTYLDRTSDSTRTSQRIVQRLLDRGVFLLGAELRFELAEDKRIEKALEYITAYQPVSVRQVCVFLCREFHITAGKAESAVTTLVTRGQIEFVTPSQVALVRG